MVDEVLLTVDEIEKQGGPEKCLKECLDECPGKSPPKGEPCPECKGYQIYPSHHRYNHRTDQDDEVHSMEVMVKCDCNWMIDDCRKCEGEEKYIHIFYISE